jgi:hypothetical protein
MKNKKLRNALIFALIAISGYVAAQLLSPAAPSPSELFPPNALVYWETPNLREFLIWWKNSELKSNWQTTDNYKTFENSRLYLKLQDRINSFTKQKLEFTLDNLIKLSGKRSALAVYDIGELKTVAVTELSEADATVTELWAAKAKFKEGNFGIQKYYIEPEEGKLSFAYSKPFLIISTDSVLLETFITNNQNKEGAVTLAQTEKWKACRFETAPLPLFSIYADQESLNENRYFKKYWVHKNAKDFSPIRSVWIDFLAEPKGLIEHRYFAFAEPSQNSAANDSIIKDWADQFRKLSADLIEIESSPAPEKVSATILKMLNRFPNSQKEASYPQPYSASFEKANEAELKSPYLVRVDAPIIQSANVQVLQIDQPQTLTTMFTSCKPEAWINLRTPIWDKDGLFVHFQQTQILLLGNYDSLQQQDFLDQLRSYFLLLTSAGENGASWSQKDGTYTLYSLNPLYVKFQKPWIIVSNNANELNNASAVLPHQLEAPHSSLVEIDWEKGRWKYSRLMRRLDYGAYRGDEPLLFSENLDSLFKALYPIKKSTIEKSENKETVRYEVR